MYTAAIITLSDKGSAGDRIDKSGPLIKKIIEPYGFEIVDYSILPDEEDLLAEKLIDLSDISRVNLILTTGGTGFSPRDRTPEATKRVLDREVPGIAEAMRYYSLQITPKAMLSRALSGLRGSTLIINLPGSPKAVKENLEAIIEPVLHGLDIMLQYDSECGSDANGPS
jgi:molybdenum cofactor synthesis domain-containing protein